MRLRAPLVVGCLATLVGCTSDLNAPSNYLLPDGTDGGDIELLCGTVPGSAVEANFAYTPEVGEGVEEDLTFSAEGLPDGLTIDANSGEISGQPTTEGAYSFTVTAVGDEGGMGQVTCDVTVAPRVDVDLDSALLAAQPFCLQANESLLDYIVDGTGDGTPITCDHVQASGNGRLPAGITINPDTCTAEGNLAETRYGTYVFAMRGLQSGVDVYMPYCITQDSKNFSYDVQVVHSGEDPAALIPIGRTFDPAQSLAVGVPDDPDFTIIHEPSCGDNSCFFGFSFGINASPFDASTFGLPNRELLRNAMDRPIGFTHEMVISGDPVPEDFVNRPWVVNISLDYCLAPDDQTCDGAANTQANGDGHLEMGIIMVPQQG